MSKENQLKEIHASGKSYAIYKSINGFDLYTDFSKKITLNNKNVSGFFDKKRISKKPKETDLFIGFFGYEVLCNLLNIRLKNQKKTNFYKGIFYKPETVITISDKIKISSLSLIHI